VSVKNLKRQSLNKEFLCMIKSGSPDCSIDRTFASTFYFPRKATKTKPIKPLYRNPIYLAREYKQIIDAGQVKNQADLARKLNVSRVRICQILSLLKLNPFVVQELEKLGDLLKSKIISERILRSYVNKSSKEQKALLIILKTLFLNYKERGNF
jgi:hypothetical protein